MHELKRVQHELRVKLRRLESGSSHASAFELYEADVHRLQAALETSQEEAKELELTCREAAMAYEVARDAARVATGEQWPGGISATMETKLQRVRHWRQRLSTSDKEAERLRAELAAGKQKIRQGEVHKRSAEDATRRLHKMAKDYEKVRAAAPPPAQRPQPPARSPCAMRRRDGRAVH